MKKFAWYLSFRKEQHWLETMAQKGWKLSKMTMGVFYTFEPIEPQRLLYETDRFPMVADNTPVEELEARDDFLSLAMETGWETVAKDETMNYYFCKPYEEGGANELYDDPTAAKERAMRFSGFFSKQASELLLAQVILTVVYLLAILLLGDRAGKLLSAFYMVLTLIELMCITMLQKAAMDCERELSISKVEWEKRIIDFESQTFIVRKYPHKAKALAAFLTQKAQDGWQVCAMEKGSLVFDKHRPGNLEYACDPMKSLAMVKCPDRHLESMKIARELGYTPALVLAQGMIYKRQPNGMAQLNVKDGRLTQISTLKALLIIIAISLLVGGVIGLVVGLLLP